MGISQLQALGHPKPNLSSAAALAAYDQAVSSLVEKGSKSGLGLTHLPLEFKHT